MVVLEPLGRPHSTLASRRQPYIISALTGVAALFLLACTSDNDSVSVVGSGGGTPLGGSSALGGSSGSGGSAAASSNPQSSGGASGGQQSTSIASGGQTPWTGGTGTTSGLHAEISRYDYTLDLHTTEAASRLTISARNNADGCVQLASDLELKEVTASPGYTVSLDTGGMAICGSFRAEQPLTLATKQTVQRRSDASTGVDFSERADRSGNTFSYLLGWFEKCARFGPCDPSPAQLSHFTFAVTHKANDVVLCPGVRKADSTHTLCELLETAAPTYSSFGIAAHTAWIAHPLVQAAGVTVETYDTPQSALHTALDANAVGEYLDWITALLGPYPYGNPLRIAAAPVTWLGMEHPGNIVVREDVATVFTGYVNTPLHVALHEIAHQWAGDQTTPGVTLTVTQIHPNHRIFPCVVDVDLNTAERTQRVQVDFGRAPTSATVSTPVALNEPVVSLRIDPDRRLLAWPQGFSVAALTTPTSIRFHP